MTAIEAVLLDVGGTLWPNLPTRTGDPIATAAARLSTQLELDPGDATALAARLIGSDGTDRSIVGILGFLGALDADLDLRAVRRAMCQPAAEVLRPFPGSEALLRALTVPVAIVSNAIWRDGAAYADDFRDFGLEGLVDVYVSSVDVGFRKPHPAMFQTALDALHADPARTVMVGDSEVNDILPAAALGMRTVLVAIESEPPATSAADAICSSLAAVHATIVH